jgi:hypothetical protein
VFGISELRLDEMAHFGAERHSLELFVQLLCNQLVYEPIACVNHQGIASDVEVLISSIGRYCSFAYSALASFRMGMSGSASFQRARKS